MSPQSESYEVFKIRWVLTVQGLVCKEQDFKLNSEYKRESMERNQYK